MVDYAKKTVAELTEILKSRNLSHTGKKAELVARLNEADKEVEEPAPAAEEPAAPPAPEAPVETTAPSTQPTTTETEAAPASAPAAPIPAEESLPANTDSALASGVTYALNLPSSEVDAELAKRKARAERFGTVNGDSENKEADDEAQKALQRAKRFGTGAQSLGKLDEALPLERERGSRKRGRTEGGGGEDGGLRKNFRHQGGGGGRGRFRGGGGGGGRNGRDKSQRRQGERPTGVVKSPPAYTSEADRAAAEARKKKFGS
ncbi:hypothetical protein, variant [Exophiala mesophila]|uniref:SAP domain-containing protein n=1 Tax=Exophiala mesophila TaxID=212818 RepID=A0A0D1ZTT9_EXOME|nr:hypothetical protein, variant [Exophiala mesophila]KIV90228.1 hypothetical protein, variant [Exophiala mesophila]